MSTGRFIASFLLCALSCAFAATASAQPFGYIVNAADTTEDGTHDNLWQVDLATGETQRIGPINLPNASNPQSDIEGLALKNANELYGVDDGVDSLVLVSMTTGSALPLQRLNDNLQLSMGASALDPGLAFDCSGDLLMSSATRRTLYRLNQSTGQAVVVGTAGGLGVKIGDISVRRGEIFGVGIDGDEGLYRIDGTAGTATLVGRFGVDLKLANVGIDMDASGTIWAAGHIVNGQGLPQPSRIFRINRETGQATLGPTTKTGVKSLAIRRPNCGSDGGGGEDPPRGGPTTHSVPVGTPGTLIILIVSLLLVARRRLF